MTFVFESLNDVAKQLETKAATCRKQSTAPNILLRRRYHLEGEAFGYEQAAYLLRNAEFKDIAA